MNLSGLGLRSRLGSTARILAGLRRRLARWIYPEGCACEKEAPSPRTREILRLTEAFVRHHGFAELTQQTIKQVFYKWVGYKKYRYKRVCRPHAFHQRRILSENIMRLFKHPSVCPRDKTYHGVIQVFSKDWPADLPWPSDIPRPAPTPAHPPA